MSKSKGVKSVQSKDKNFVFPTPSELARLSAQISPGIFSFNPKEMDEAKVHEAMRLAFEVYLNAYSFLEEVRNKSWDELVQGYARNTLYHSFFSQKIESMCIRFYPKRDTDQLRDLLAAKGLEMKKPRTVKDNLKAFYIERAIAQGKDEQKGIQQFEIAMIFSEKEEADGEKFYLFQPFLVEDIIRWKRNKKVEGTKKGHLTRKGQNLSQNKK